MSSISIGRRKIRRPRITSEVNEIINHESLGIGLHLFVRENKLGER